MVIYSQNKKLKKYDTVEKVKKLYFNNNIFIEEFNSGERAALNYIYKTIIKPLEIDADIYTKNEYIITLFKAVDLLNTCLYIYEESKVKTAFNFDYYANIRDLLFKELNIKTEVKK